MESKVNYTLVGLFVLLLGAVAIIIPLWLTSGLNQEQYTTYQVYMNEAVDGLSMNSPVKYNGVDVGFVRDIRLNLKNLQQVILLLNIKQGIPITTNTTAVLRAQGITGVEYIGISGGKPGGKPLVVQPGERYPVIKSAPSIMIRLDAILTQITNSITKLGQRLDLIFTEQNAKLLTSNLNNLDKITANFSKNSPQLNVAIKNISQTSQGMPDIAAQLQSVLQNLQVISNDIKQNPSVVIRGKAKPPLGPGEGN